MRYRLQHGFTLIEMLVATFIFSIVLVAVSSTFFRALNQQRRSYASQRVHQNLQATLDHMARDIRVSQVQNQDSNCALNSLTLTHPTDGPVIYTLSGGQVQRTTVGGSVVVTASDVAISRMVFCVSGSAPYDTEQSRVTILMQGVSNASVGGTAITADVQTTIVVHDTGAELR